MKVLFVLKYRQGYNGYDSTFSSGLYNSALLVVQMLTRLGIVAKLVEVVDNNRIDAEVAKFKPDVVIIEGLWVVPDKFAVLRRLHPKVRWIVRIHSEVPFLAQEGIAVDWVFGYISGGINVAFNSDRAFADVRKVTAAHQQKQVIYLPNYYPLCDKVSKKPDKTRLDVGCFGALRGAKNQLNQALAAILYADKKSKVLYFHINEAFHGGTDGPNILKNLKALFAYSKHSLVTHPWLRHDDFVKLVETMDIGMQVSFSESFNITSADFAARSIPLVVSPEVRWASKNAMAPPNCVDRVADMMAFAFGFLGGSVKNGNLRGLTEFSKTSEKVWTKELSPATP